LRYLREYTSLEVAVDRFFFSELVYGPFQRRDVAFDDRQLRGIAMRLSTEHITVFCCPPFTSIASKLDDPGDSNFARCLYESYRGLMIGGLHNLIQYDWTRAGQYDNLVEHLKEMQQSKRLIDKAKQVRNSFNN